MLKSHPASTAPMTPSSMSSNLPSPVLLMMRLPTKPAISPSPIQVANDNCSLLLARHAQSAALKAVHGLCGGRAWDRGIGALCPRSAKALGVRQRGLFIRPNICAVANLLLAARRFDEPGLGLVESFSGQSCESRVHTRRTNQTTKRISRTVPRSPPPIYIV